MKVCIYSVFDSVALVYLEPFYAPSDAVARRMFATSVNRSGHPFSENPDDFCLFKHGQIDLTDASFDTHEPVSLGVGIEYVKE